MNNQAYKWNHTRYSQSIQKSVPDRPGVYMITETKRLYNLPLKIEILYVGKSNNLRRRLGEHLNIHGGRNNKIKQLRLTNSSPLEYWYQELPKNEISTFEKDLIRNLQPEYNTLLKAS